MSPTPHGSFDVRTNGRARELAEAEAAAARKKRPGTRRRLLKMPAYQPFPVDAMPEPIRTYVDQGAKALHCDPAFLAVPALAVAAGLIGDTREIRLRPTWREPCIVWGAVVSESGTMKSPAYKLVVRPLWKMERRLSDEYKAAYRQYLRDKRAAEENDTDPPDKPVRKQVVVSDVTIEKVTLILDSNPRGLILARDELSGWLNGFARYKAQKGVSDVPNWLEIHGAGAVSYERKTGENSSVFLPRALASVTGTIQPRILAGALENEDLVHAGLLARLLMAMPPKGRKQRTELEIAPEVEADYVRVLDRLWGLEPDTGDDGDPTPRTLRLSPDAKGVFVNFYNVWAEEQREAEGEMASCLAKLEAYAGRLALLHHVVSCAGLELNDRFDIRAESMEAGIRLTRWFGAEHRRIYATLAEGREERELRHLLELIQARGGSITVKDLMRSNNRKYPTADHARAALESLLMAGYGEWVDRPAGPKGGRPTEAFELCMTHDETDETSREPGMEDAEDA